VTGICLGDKRSSPFKTRTQLANELEHLIMGGTCGDGNRAKFLIIRYPVSVQLCHLNSSTAALIDQQIPNPTATGDGKQAAFPSGEAEPRPPQHAGWIVARQPFGLGGNALGHEEHQPQGRMWPWRVYRLTTRIGAAGV